MISNLFQKLVPGGLLYIRIKHDWLSVRDVRTGYYYEDIPVAAVKNMESRKIAAIGFEARSLVSDNREYTIVNGFEDPVSIISDARAAEKTLHYFMDSVIKKGLLQPPIRAILHPTEIGKGKLTKQDAVLLRNLAIRAGAAEAYVWVGIEPMHKEIIDGDFPPRGEWVTEPPGWAKDPLTKAGA